MLTADSKSPADGLESERGSDSDGDRQGYGHPIAECIGRHDEHRCSAVRDELADHEVQVDESGAESRGGVFPAKSPSATEGVHGYNQSRVCGCAKCLRHHACEIEQRPENDNEDDSQLSPARGIGATKRAHKTSTDQ